MVEPRASRKALDVTTPCRWLAIWDGTGLKVRLIHPLRAAISSSITQPAMKNTPGKTDKARCPARARGAFIWSPASASAVRAEAGGNAGPRATRLDAVAAAAR